MKMNKNMKRLLTIMTLLATAVAPLAAQTHKHTMKYTVNGGEELYLDRYVSDKANGKRPCVIFVFGGGFATGVRDAEKYVPYFDMLTENGYDVVSVDYRLGLKATQSPDYDSKSVGLLETIRTMKNSVNIAVEDVLTATKIILDNAGEWNIDTSKIIVSGSSAGAITSLQAENNICNRTDLAKILPANFNYAGVIAFAGAIFSTSGKPDWDTKPCPVMLFHGNSDSNVPYEKAALLGIGFYGPKILVEQFDEMGTPYYFYSATYRSHVMAEEPMIKNHDEILEFLDKYVMRGQRLQITETVVDLEIEPQPTSFGIREYLSANYDTPYDRQPELK